MENIEKHHYSDIEFVDIIHQVSQLYVSTKIPHDYGTGEIYTSVEVHTLKHISDNLGITGTKLSKMYGKSKAAISQILKKIEEKGLIYREVDLENDKIFHLFLTNKGKTLDSAHREYDNIFFGESMSKVRDKFSQDEIDTVFKVLEYWLGIRREVQQQRIAAKRGKKREERKTKKFSNG